GKRYAPKAVIGLACQLLTGRPFGPEDFSGGWAPGQANYVLSQLGFKVEPKGASMQSDEAIDWTDAEVALALADYFVMLKQELLGRPYSKKAHRDALRPLLAGRSDASVEYKHRNISAVLVGLGLPYIAGYKPAGNYQALLARAVENYLLQHAGYLE